MTESTPIFILADDLTGAADTANYFRTPNRRVRVSLDAAQPWDLQADQSTVQVFDAETRALPAASAAETVAQACAQLADGQARGFVYKKIDSTLRGNIGAEIVAAMTSLHRRVALVAPAFPGAGRTVRDGQLLVHGVPIHQTEFAADPHQPIHDASVANRLAMTAQIPVIRLPLSIIEEGQPAVIAWSRQHADRSCMIVADAVTDTHLQTLADVIADLPELLPVGSAGLARKLAGHWLGDAASHTASLPGPIGKRLYLIGSANRIAHEQVAALRSAQQVAQIELSASRLIDSRFAPDEIAQAQLAVASSQAAVTVVSLSQERVPDTATTGLVDAVARVAAAWLASDPLQGVTTPAIFATGGDMAIALCKVLGQSEIWTEQELLPGIPWSWLKIPGKEIVLVSKAGGFGDEQTLCQIDHRLQTGNVNMEMMYHE